MLDGNLRPAANLPLIGYTGQAAGQQQSSSGRAKYLHIFTFVGGSCGGAAVKAQLKVPTRMRKLFRTHTQTHTHNLCAVLKVA